jgi:hypothetical protein
MTMGEGALNRARTRAERVRLRKSRHRKQVDSARLSKGYVAPRGRHTRQRFNTSISLDGGSRLRLPSLRLIRTGARIPALLLLSISVWGILTIYSASEFQVIQPEVSGIQYMSPSRVRTIAGASGRSIFKVDPSEIDSLLESLPEVESAKVEVHWPNKVVIEIVERLPVLAWNDAGQTWLLGAEGLAFYHRGTIPGLVHVHSLTSVLKVGDPLDPVIGREKIMAAYDLSMLLGNYSPLLYDERHGFGFQDERGWMAYFGSTGDMAAKFEIYEEIAALLDLEGYPATLISVEDLEGPFYR